FVFMLGTSSGSLQYDPEIERTARANRKGVRLVKEAARLVELEHIISEEEETTEEEVLIEMADNVQNPPPPPPPRRTLGD
ncbi:hypothetical protein A2U01_0094239, partial [Trifolium medium]|nr:hypothetical protein [Trifolium medium]